MSLRTNNIEEKKRIDTLQLKDFVQFGSQDNAA